MPVEPISHRTMRPSLRRQGPFEELLLLELGSEDISIGVIERLRVLNELCQCHLARSLGCRAELLHILGDLVERRRRSGESGRSATVGSIGHPADCGIVKTNKLAFTTRQ